MQTDLILHTSSPEHIYRASIYARDTSLTLLYSGSETFTLASGSHILFYTSTKNINIPFLQTLTSGGGTPFFLLLNDETFDQIEHFRYLDLVASTIPRLASLGLSSRPGIHEILSNRFFGTLYARRVLGCVSGWVDHSDLSLSSFEWARQTWRQGWYHLAAWSDPVPDLPPIDSGVGVKVD